MVVAQGDVFWADLPTQDGAEDGFWRPVVVVQCDAFNRSKITTVVCVPLTSNLRWAEAPGNVLLSKRDSGLSKDSVANVSQLITIDREFLARRAGKLSARRLAQILAGIDVLLGR